jgi:hypothetical protein
MQGVPRVSPEEAAKIAKSGRTALWLGGAALVLSLFFFYLGIVAAAGAVYVGLRAQAAGRRAGMLVRGAVPGIVMGIVGGVLSLSLLALSIYVWNDLQSYASCKDTANTVADQKTCKDKLSRDLERKFHMPKGSITTLPF